MLKLIGSKTTRNGGVVGIEQFFTPGEKDFATARAAELQANPEFRDIRLLEVVQAKVLIPTAVVLATPTTGATEYRNRRLVGSKFAWVKFGTPAPKAKKPRSPRKVAATAEGFDLPPAPKKRVAKREREFGPGVLHRTLDTVAAE